MDSRRTGGGLELALTSRVAGLGASRKHRKTPPRGVTEGQDLYVNHSHF